MNTHIVPLRCLSPWLYRGCMSLLEVLAVQLVTLVLLSASASFTCRGKSEGRFNLLHFWAAVQTGVRLRESSVFFLFVLLHQPLSLSSVHTYTHPLPALAAARAGVMLLWHSQRRLGPVWCGLLNKSWIWLRTNRSPVFQAPYNMVLDLFPPLAGIWRFATQTSEREEAFAEFPLRMSSLLPFMCCLCPEHRFLLRCYRCAFHTDALSVSACAAWFLS